MSYCGVSIFSDNLSGQTANVTFFPCSGGTIDLGEQVFPFTYYTDYWYGTYDCYVPMYAYTYTIDVPCLTPTPTVSPTNTPTVTPTVTTTTTPTYTPTPSTTATIGLTPTATPTNTESPTQTPSGSNSPLRFVFNVYTGTTSEDACGQINGPVTIYGNDPQFDYCTQFWNVAEGSSTIDMTGFYNNSYVVVELDSNGFQIGGYSLCPTATPTPTITPTITPTPINYEFELIYGSNPNEACSGTDTAFYGTRSGGPTLDVGEILYTNAETTTTAPDGYYGAGTTFYLVSGGTGEIVEIYNDGCINLDTPTPTPTLTNTPTPSVTPSNYHTGPFNFDFDYMVCEYYFDDGIDMDTMAFFTVPNVMLSNSGDTSAVLMYNGNYYNYVGTCAYSSSGPQWPNDGILTPYLIYGGDNTGTGTEAVLFDLIEFKLQNPLTVNLEFAFTANWYTTVGNNPVKMRATLYKGGSMVQEGYTWYNVGYSSVYYVESNGTVITENVQDCQAFELVSNLQFNISTHDGQFI